MSEGNPTQSSKYTPEQIAEIEKSRTISEAELLEKGAEYVVGKEGEKMLVDVTGEGSAIAEELMTRESQLANTEDWFSDYREKLATMLEKESIHKGDIIEIHKLARTHQYDGAIHSFEYLGFHGAWLLVKEIGRAYEHGNLDLGFGERMDYSREYGPGVIGISIREIIEAGYRIKKGDIDFSRRRME